MADGYTIEDRPRRRRGRRLLIALLVLLALLAVALVVLDRAGAAFAERRIADQVTAELARRQVRSTAPDVSVGGVPFLTQVLAGNYRRISVALRDLSSDNADTLPKGVRVQRLDVLARDVAAPLQALRTGQGDIVAKNVDGTAVLDYASVAAMLGQPGVTVAERNGRLAVTAPLELLGQKFTVNGTAELKVVEGAVQVRFREMTADGLAGVPGAQGLLNGYAEKISIDMPFGQLPFGLAVKDVQPRPEGLVLTATAANVVLNAAGR